jgi:hypothetical protein
MLSGPPVGGPIQTLAPTQIWKIDEINLQFSILLNYKFNDVQSGIVNAA